MRHYNRISNTKTPSFWINRFFVPLKIQNTLFIVSMRVIYSCNSVNLEIRTSFVCVYGQNEFFIVYLERFVGLHTPSKSYVILLDITVDVKNCNICDTHSRTRTIYLHPFIWTNCTYTTKLSRSSKNCFFC